MSSRTLTWHNVDECTYRFGSHPNCDAGKPGDQKPVTMGTKTTSMTTKPTSIETTTAKQTKTTSIANTTSMEAKTATSKANMKPTTKTTFMRESDRDERMLRMLHDAIFWVPPSDDANLLTPNHTYLLKVRRGRPCYLSKTWRRNRPSTFIKCTLCNEIPKNIKSILSRYQNRLATILKKMSMIINEI